jgi:hypothetical protein
MSGSIVLVSGTSGAGKTTVARTFARRAGELYLMFGMDVLVGTLFPSQYTIFGTKRHEGFTGTFGEGGLDGAPGDARDDRRGVTPGAEPRR